MLSSSFLCLIPQALHYSVADRCNFDSVRSAAFIKVTQQRSLHAVKGLGPDENVTDERNVVYPKPARKKNCWKIYHYAVIKARLYTMILILFLRLLDFLEL